MKPFFKKAAIVSAAASLALAAGCSQSDKQTEAAKADALPEAPKVLASGIDKQYFDESVGATSDFYRHVNGVWLKNTEIPADKSNYGAFTKLNDDAQVHLREIIEEAQKSADMPGSNQQKIGALFASFMDEEGAEKNGFEPIKSLLAEVDAMKSHADLPTLLASLAKKGVQQPIGGFINQDAKDSTTYTVYFFQNAQISLPDRDYYLEDNEKFNKVRAAYVTHLGNTLSLIGEKDAEKRAKEILALETAFAKAHWTRVESRDDDKTYNKFKISELSTLTPDFDFTQYVKLGVGDKIDSVIVMQPSAYTAFAKELKKSDIGTIKAFLKYRVAETFAPYLSTAFVNENFNFYSTILRGVPENRPRWKRGVDVVEGALGEVLGEVYVKRHFPEEAKKRMNVLVQNLTLAYEQSIKDLDWMTGETKEKALLKLSKFTPKIGYPDEWKDYSGLEIKADDLVGNIIRSNELEVAREIAKLGKPIDRKEWFMTPQTVNAYYNPGMNEIVFPAAILQPPFFNLEADDAVNYGGIGAVIGHEFGHGFDDQGSKYDGDGNLKSWWTEEDRAQFEERTRALIAQYNEYCPLENECVNGALTIGENIGDLGGLSIAYKAYKLSLAGKEPPVLDGYTGDQRFFIGWAQVWRRKYREEELLNRLKTDPHSPSEYRTNGIVKNLDPFYSSFGVKEGDELYLAPEARVSIW